MCIFLYTDCLELLKVKAASALMEDCVISSNMPDSISHSATDLPVPTDSIERQGKKFNYSVKQFGIHKICVELLQAIVT